MKNEIYVRAENLGHTFYQGNIAIPALKTATFEIAPRARIAIMGPSGSGKSTLLHIIAGLADATSGGISWPALGSRETLRPGKIGFIAQEQSLVTSLCVRENIELPMLFMGAGQKEAAAQAEDILKRLNLSEIADKLPDELSGGQMKRAASARALVFRPKLILADEPTGQLDHATARQFLDVLFAWIADTDIAVVMTTHDREVAGCMDVIWTMEHGILKEGAK
jgi:putative ABC transport system ATP-binding protein/lipoprotein-releasing system ATP-binding protein